MERKYEKNNNKLWTDGHQYIQFSFRSFTDILNPVQNSLSSNIFQSTRGYYLHTPNQIALTHVLCWPETNRLTDISPAMMRSPSYLRLAENCNSESATMVSHLLSPPTAREGDCFLDRRGSWEREGYRGKKKSSWLFVDWILARKEEKSFFIWLGSEVSVCENFPFWVFSSF